MSPGRASVLLIRRTGDKEVVNELPDLQLQTFVDVNASLSPSAGTMSLFAFSRATNCSIRTRARTHRHPTLSLPLPGESFHRGLSVRGFLLRARL